MVRGWSFQQFRAVAMFRWTRFYKYWTLLLVFAVVADFAVLAASPGKWFLIYIYGRFCSKFLGYLFWVESCLFCSIGTTIQNYLLFFTSPIILNTGHIRNVPQKKKIFLTTLT